MTRYYTMTDPDNSMTVIYDGTEPWKYLAEGAYPTTVWFDDTDGTYTGVAFVQSNSRDDFEFASDTSAFEFDRNMLAYYKACVDHDNFKSVRVVDYGINSMGLIVTRNDGKSYAAHDHDGWASDELGYTDVPDGTSRRGMYIVQVFDRGDDYVTPVGDPVYVNDYATDALVININGM